MGMAVLKCQVLTLARAKGNLSCTDTQLHCFCQIL